MCVQDVIYFYHTFNDLDWWGRGGAGGFGIHINSVYCFGVAHPSYFLLQAYILTATTTKPLFFCFLILTSH